jgi:hypothetical protein
MISIIAGPADRARRPTTIAAEITIARKKGRLNDKRPKSREETPKEGSGNAKRYRTATICGRAAQSARAFELILVHIRRVWPQ